MDSCNITYYDDDFPLLEGSGLYASHTSGNGDCLFYALSDQLYGHEELHREVRQRVVEHLRSNSDYFKAFIDVIPVRRALRRKAATRSGRVSTHSEYEIDRAFNERLQRMQQPGVFGDNLEVQAFAREYGVDVKIYQRECIFVIQGAPVTGRESDERQVVHIAYHTWEHYSSVRNRDGPYTGPPNVSPRPASPDMIALAQDKLSRPPSIAPWMETAVTTSLPYSETSEKIRSALTKYKCDVNAAVSHLIDEWERCVLESQCVGQQDGEDKGGASNSFLRPNQTLQLPTPADSDDERCEKRRKSPRGTPINVSPRSTPEKTLSPVTDDEGRGKRRKSPDGSPISCLRPQTPTPLDLAFDAETRKRPASEPAQSPKQIPTPTRRSPRIQAKTAAARVSTGNSLDGESLCPEDSAGTKTLPAVMSRKARREEEKSARKGINQQKEVPTVERVTTDIRELYV